MFFECCLTVLAQRCSETSGVNRLLRFGSALMRTRTSVISIRSSAFCVRARLDDHFDSFLPCLPLPASYRCIFFFFFDSFFHLLLTIQAELQANKHPDPYRGVYSSCSRFVLDPLAPSSVDGTKWERNIPPRHEVRLSLISIVHCVIYMLLV